MQKCYYRIFILVSTRLTESYTDMTAINMLEYFYTQKDSIEQQSLNFDGYKLT
jgi:hypothetical protein